MSASTRGEVYNLLLLSDPMAAAAPDLRDYVEIRRQLLAAFDALMAERDAARAELESPELRYEIASKFCHETQIEYEAAGPRSPHESIAATNRVLARWGRAAGKNVGSASQTDPRIEAWRGLDAEQRSYRVEDLRTWADLVEAGATLDGADHGPSPLRIAAACLEALGEKA